MRMRYTSYLYWYNPAGLYCGSSDRSYEPTGITDVLSNLNFISDHLNVCILGAAASGKSYLAKAIGIQACQQFSVEYHTCEDLLSDLAELKKSNYEQYTRKIKHLTRLDLLILDDFLLHTIDDHRRPLVNRTQQRDRLNVR